MTSAQERWNDAERFISEEFAAGRFEYKYDLSKILPEIDRDEDLETKPLASMTRLVLGKHKFPLHDKRADADAFDVPREGDLAVGFVLIADDDDESNDDSSGMVTLEIFMGGAKVGETRIAKPSRKDGRLLARTPFFESRFMVNLLITNHSVRFRVNNSDSVTGRGSDKSHLRVVYAMMPRGSRRVFAQRGMVCRIQCPEYNRIDVQSVANDRQCLVFAKGTAGLVKESEFPGWAGHSGGDVEFIEQRGIIT